MRFSNKTCKIAKASKVYWFVRFMKKSHATFRTPLGGPSPSAAPRRLPIPRRFLGGAPLAALRRSSAALPPPLGGTSVEPHLPLDPASQPLLPEDTTTQRLLDVLDYSMAVTHFSTSRPARTVNGPTFQNVLHTFENGSFRRERCRPSVTSNYF